VHIRFHALIYTVGHHTRSYTRMKPGRPQRSLRICSIREPDTSATSLFGTKTLRHQLQAESPVELCLVGIVLDLMPKCLSRTTFLAQKCLETVLKCRMRVRSVLVPKCLVAEVSGSLQDSSWMKNADMVRGVATGGIWGIYTPKSVQVMFLWGKNDA